MHLPNNFTEILEIF